MNATEKVRRRLERAAAALDGAGVPYAVVGANAVAIHVARVGETLVRNTRDVDILVRRADFPKPQAALESAGFVYPNVAGLDVFLDGPDSKAGDGVHLLFADEKVRDDALSANPSVYDSERAASVMAVSLEALVRLKLTAFRDKDPTHIRDLIGVGLVDLTWVPRLPPPLAARLTALLDDPNG